jgi:hypothetical protein
MIPTGLGAELKDKRVDKILLAKGVKGDDCEVFYSPISGCILYLALAMVNIIALLFYQVSYILYFYFFISSIFLSIFSILLYLFLAYTNFSFCVTKESLYCINPNFPFRNFSKFNFSEIESIVAAKSFCNYLIVKKNIGQKKFYCYFLQPDAFDENITKLTFDDLMSVLSNKIELVNKID